MPTVMTVAMMSSRSWGDVCRTLSRVMIPWRMGGDEFTVLLRYIDSPKKVVEAVHRILQGTQAPWEIDRHSLELTVSIGIAMYPSDGSDTRTLIKNADEALYYAKNRGKNTYVFYDSSVRP